MTLRQSYSIDQIKDMLLAQLDTVVHRYAPPAKGAHTTRGKYFTLNPGRADRHVGSFCVTMTGAQAGKWTDYATGEFGDVLDLIALAQNCDLTTALKEARAFLGLETLSPADRRRREDQAARARARRREQAAAEREDRKKRAGSALKLWLSGQEQLRGTPVEYYLQGARAVDLGRLGRQPGALRYLPDCFYQHIDDTTGEVYRTRFPAMVAIVTDHMGRAVACHRTYLALDPQGRWDKAPIPADWPFEPKAWKAKKVLGDYAGAWISIWKGRGPRGGTAPSISKAPFGSHVYITEGIEDALSTTLLLPDARVIAGISLGNLAALKLPAAITSLTLVADQDENDQARAQLGRAIAAHQDAGREVKLWQNRHGGKDLNDAWRSAAKADRPPAGNGPQSPRGAAPQPAPDQEKTA